MQRGCVSTLAASAKMARERSPESEIEAKSDGDRKLLLVVGVCAELVTEPMSAAQQSKLGNDIGRIMPAPSIAITTFPGCKSSFRKAQDLRKPKPDGGRSGAERLSRPGAGPGHAGSVRSMKSRTSAMGQSSRRDPADGKREPIGPGAIVVDDKVVNIVTFPLALGRTDAGGPARVTPVLQECRGCDRSTKRGEACPPSRLREKHHVARNNPAHRPDYHLARRL